MADARLSVRVDLPTGRFGPGKAALLRAIDEAGSIAGAARALGMSYARAWSLTESMSRAFDRPLVERHVGGHDHGGSRLTDDGRKLLALYERINAESERASADALEDMLAMTR